MRLCDLCLKPGETKDVILDWFETPSNGKKIAAADLCESCTATLETMPVAEAIAARFGERPTGRRRRTDGKAPKPASAPPAK